jgi:hypothetical protein
VTQAGCRFHILERGQHGAILHRQRRVEIRVAPNDPRMKAPCREQRD